MKAIGQLGPAGRIKTHIMDFGKTCVEMSI
jgi:hypothetical protein